MLDAQFFGLNLHFVANLLAALVMFSVFWLIFDAWSIRRSRKEILKWGGFLALSIGFTLRAADIQTQNSGLAVVLQNLADIFRLAGYAAVALGQLVDPLQKRPAYVDPLLGQPGEAGPLTAPGSDELKRAGHGKAKKTTHQSHRALISGPAATIFPWLLPIGALTVSRLYYRRATIGLELHLKPVAWSFLGLGLFELLDALTRLKSSDNPNIFQLLHTYGPVWWAAQAVLCLAVIILGRWVWRYLTKRLQSQLFMLLVGLAIALFIFSTVGFTYLLQRNIQNQSLADLSTASRVLDYAVTSRQAETLSQAEAVAGNPSVISVLAAGDRTIAAANLAGYMSAHELTTLVVVNASGQVILRGEDPERSGDSLSADPLVRRGIIGEASSSVIVRSGVVAPSVVLVAASPIRAADSSIIGVVMVGRAVSNAFVDGIRTSTGLESAVYGGNIRAATTITSPDGGRAIGIIEASPAINTQVLSKGQAYRGFVSFQGRPYLAAITALKDIYNQPVGMLLVARPEDTLYSSADGSIQLTFVFVVGLIFVAIYPVYRISKFLSDQFS